MEFRSEASRGEAEGRSGGAQYEGAWLAYVTAYWGLPAGKRPCAAASGGTALVTSAAGAWAGPAGSAIDALLEGPRDDAADQRGSSQ